MWRREDAVRGAVRFPIQLNRTGRPIFNHELNWMERTHSFQLTIEINGRAPFVSIVNWNEWVCPFDSIESGIERVCTIHFNCQLNWKGWRRSNQLTIESNGRTHSFQLSIELNGLTPFFSQLSIEMNGCAPFVSIDNENEKEKRTINQQSTSNRMQTSSRSGGQVSDSIESNAQTPLNSQFNWIKRRTPRMSNRQLIRIKGRVPATQTNALSDQSNVNQQSTGNRMRKRRGGVNRYRLLHDVTSIDRRFKKNQRREGARGSKWAGRSRQIHADFSHGKNPRWL